MVLKYFKNRIIKHRQSAAYTQYNMLIIGDSQVKLFCKEIENSHLMIDGYKNVNKHADLVVGVVERTMKM